MQNDTSNKNEIKTRKKKKKMNRRKKSEIYDAIKF